MRELIFVAMQAELVRQWNEGRRGAPMVSPREDGTCLIDGTVDLGRAADAIAKALIEHVPTPGAELIERLTAIADRMDALADKIDGAFVPEVEDARDLVVTFDTPLSAEAMLRIKDDLRSFADGAKRGPVLIEGGRVGATIRRPAEHHASLPPLLISNAELRTLTGADITPDEIAALRSVARNPAGHIVLYGSDAEWPGVGLNGERVRANALVKRGFLSRSPEGLRPMVYMITAAGLCVIEEANSAKPIDITKAERMALKLIAEISTLTTQTTTYWLEEDIDLESLERRGLISLERTNLYFRWTITPLGFRAIEQEPL